MDNEKFCIIQRKGVTVTRKRSELQSYLNDGWKEVVIEPKKPVTKKGNNKK